jgi:hypothetical protein
MLNYFQLLYDYFSLIKKFSPCIIYGYLWLFSIIFGYCMLIFYYCKLFQFRLLVVIISYFWLLKVISRMLLLAIRLL